MSVFAVYPKTNGVTQIRGCTSRRNKDTGEFENDFSGYCSCIGNQCAQKALTLKPADGHPVRIRLGDIEVRQVFEKGADGKQKLQYTNFNIYSFDTSEESEKKTAASNEPPNPVYEGISDDVDEEGLPF